MINNLQPCVNYFELPSNEEKNDCSLLSPRIAKEIYFPDTSLQLKKKRYFKLPPPPPQRRKRRNKRKKKGRIAVKETVEMNWNIITRSRSGNARELLPMVVGGNIFFAPTIPSISVQIVSAAIIKKSHVNCNRALPPIPK